MKLWLNDNAKSSGGKRFFARVEEIMVDKDGKPVYLPKAPSSVVEPAPAQEAEAPVIEAAPAPATPVVVVNNTLDGTVINLLNELSGRCDAIIEILNKKETPAPVVVVAPAEEKVEEVVEEPAPQEEVVEEVAATEFVDFGAEDPSALVACLDVATAEEPAPVEAATEAKPAAPRSRNFAEKMRDASEIIQDRYDELKNYALRFRKLKSRISRKFDSINMGRFQFVKLGLAGKTLKLYLNMDINTTDPKFHCKDMSDKKTYVTVPTMLRIKSGRAVKYAKILIDQCAEQNGMLERRKPFVVDAMALIEESLAGKNLPETDIEVETNGDAE